jgi:integrase
MGRHRTRNKHLPPRMYLRAGRYYWIGHVDGKRPCIALGDDYVTALLRWREIEGQCDGAHTVAQIVDRHCAVADVTPATRKGYIAQSATLKRAFEGFAAIDVRPQHIRQYLDRRPATAGKREIALLSAAWNGARQAGLIDLPNPCEGVRGKPRKRQTRVSTSAEETALTAGSYQMAVIVELALLTGLRQTDLRQLTLDTIQDDGLHVTPSKTARKTGVSLRFDWTPALRACIARAKLLRRRNGSPYLFPTREGTAYTVDGFQAMWRAHCKRAGVEGLQFRALRRTAIQRAQAAGGSDQARAFAGHASVTTTEIYTHGLGPQVVKPTR